MNLILSIHLFTTFFMTGLVWFVQVVHYPLMGTVGKDNFVDYETRHTKNTTYVVAPVMLAELFSGAGLIWFLVPTPLPYQVLFANFTLLILIWISTFFIQIPLHSNLSKGFDPVSHRRLVNSNWIRTVLWTVRSIGLLLFLSS